MDLHRLAAATSAARPLAPSSAPHNRALMEP
jgi:hypothetical protein